MSNAYVKALYDGGSRNGCLIDLTDAETLFQDIAGSTPTNDRVGKALDLSGNNFHATAPASSQRPNSSVLDGIRRSDYHASATSSALESDAFSPISAPYVVVAFRETTYAARGGHLISSGPGGYQGPLADETGIPRFQVLGVPVSGVTETSGDHILEIWLDDPVRYALDGGPIQSTAVSWNTTIERITLGNHYPGAGESFDKKWFGVIYGAQVLDGYPTDIERSICLNYWNWRIGRGPAPGAPPTDEEIFRASFENVSGRDPLPTALLERTPARNLANHNVINYRYPPYRVTKRLPIPPERYPLTKPTKMMWHQDAMDPLFFMGRWAQIQARRFTDNEEEVELDMRIDDNPKSFIREE